MLYSTYEQYQTTGGTLEETAFAPLCKSALTDLTAYELGVVESWGVYAMLYTGLYFAQINLYMGGAALKPYDVWLAVWHVAVHPLWQCAGRLPRKPKNQNGDPRKPGRLEGSVPQGRDAASCVGRLPTGRDHRVELHPRYRGDRFRLQRDHQHHRKRRVWRYNRDNQEIQR